MLNTSELAYYSSQAIFLVLYLSLPVIITATLIGLLVGLFQALTQIQEQTLSFGIKLVGVILVLMITASWMGNELASYMARILQEISMPVK